MLEGFEDGLAHLFTPEVGLRTYEYKHKHAVIPTQMGRDIRIHTHKCNYTFALAYMQSIHTRRYVNILIAA